MCDYKIRVIIEVVDPDGVVVNHKGYSARTPHDFLRTEQDMSFHKDVRSAHDTMNQIFSLLDSLKKISLTQND